MRPVEERQALRSLRRALASLQALEERLPAVLARDDQPSTPDGLPPTSLGSGGASKGSHSDRTYAQATRSGPKDDVHIAVNDIVNTIELIAKAAKRLEDRARNLVSHHRSTTS